MAHGTISGREAGGNLFPELCARRTPAELEIGGFMGFRTEQRGNEVTISNGKIMLAYDLKTGKARAEGENGITLSGIDSAVKLSDGTVYSSTGPNQEGRKAVIQEIQDGFGTGKQLTVSKVHADGRTLFQRFYIYEELPYLISEVSIKGREQIGSNEITVLKAETAAFPEGEDMRFLFTPFDNDDFVRYAALPFSEIRESYEMSAVYDANSRNL